MAGVLYQFCVGCSHRVDTETSVSCPARFDPYETKLCPRHGKFVHLEMIVREGKKKKTKKGR